MNEAEFDKLAATALDRLERALRDAADELDVDLANGILTLEFADGERFVINSHAAARQIWAAANLAAMHFSWDGSRWVDSKTGAELFAEVGRIVSEKLAVPVKLGAN
jgi:CyaY protein